jgi:ketosteroid isomerase-like protein
MKLLTAFLALLALSLTASAFAQEESPSPSGSTEEKASATVEATPESTKPPSTAEEKPTATSSAAEKKEKASATSGSPKKESTASSETKKTGSASAAKPEKKMNAEATIKDSENRWEAAVANHDAATVQTMVASDFMGVSAKGKFINKSGLLDEYKSDKDTYKSAKNEKLTVRAYDKDLIVVTGAARAKGTGKDGKAFDRTYLFTDTWVDRNGQWQCVASQATLRGQK